MRSPSMQFEHTWCGVQHLSWFPTLIPLHRRRQNTLSNKVHDILPLLFHYTFTTNIAKYIAELIHPLEAMKVVNVHTGLNSQKYANELWWTGYDLNRSQYTRRMRVDWVRHDVDVPIEVREGWVENTTFLATGKSLSPMGSHESQPLLIFLLELSDEIFLLSVSIYHFWAKIPFF